MRKTVEKILNRYGSPITLHRFEGDFELRGFMQHTASLGWQNMQKVYSPIGEIPRGQYLLLLPPEPLLVKGDYLFREEIWYRVCRVEKVFYREEVIYCWCLCEEGGKLGSWGNQY